MTTTPKFHLQSIKAHIGHLRHIANAVQWETHLANKSGIQGHLTRIQDIDWSPRLNRSFCLHITRLLHVANLVSQAYLEQIRRTQGPPLQLLSQRPYKALCSKHLPLLISIARFTAENQIPLSHWFRAQFDLLRPPPGCVNIPLTVAHGHNAHTRYLEWSERQQRRFTRAHDRAQAIDTPLNEQIAQFIRLSHQFVIQQLSSLAGLAPPSLELFLWQQYPNISSWYLIAHNGFRVKYLESGACVAPHVVAHYKQYKRDKAIRSAVDKAYLSTLDELGELHVF